MSRRGQIAGRRAVLALVLAIGLGCPGASQKLVAPAPDPGDPSRLPSWDPSGPWRQFADLSAAGWSAEGLDEARGLAERIGSAAVMVVYRGRVVVAWGEVGRPLPVYSIRKAMIGALYGLHTATGLIDLDSTLGDLGVEDRSPLTEQEANGDSAAPPEVTVRRLSARGLRTALAGRVPPRARRISAGPGVLLQQLGLQRARHDPPACVRRRSVRRLRAPPGAAARHAGLGAGSRPVCARAQPLRAPGLHLQPVGSRSGPLRSALPAARADGEIGSCCPERWIDASWSYEEPLREGRGFGYLWHIGAGQTFRERHPASVLNGFERFLAVGTGGQILMVIPELDLVLVHRGDTENDRLALDPKNSRSIADIDGARAVCQDRRGEDGVERAGEPPTEELAPSALAGTRRRPPELSSRPISAEERRELTGDYRWKEQTATVFEHQGRLFVSDPLFGETELFRLADDTFWVTDAPYLRLEFTRDADGAVDGLVAREKEMVLKRERVRSR